MSKPECTCKFSRKGKATIDPACHYHGDNGTMVAVVPISKPKKPPAPLPRCPTCGRPM